MYQNQQGSSSATTTQGPSSGVGVQYFEDKIKGLSDQNQIKEQVDDMQAASITPRTHVERNFDLTHYVSPSHQAGSAIGSSSVSSSGVSASSSGSAGVSIPNSGPQSAPPSSQTATNTNNNASAPANTTQPYHPYYVDKYEGNGITVSHFGINVSCPSVVIAANSHNNTATKLPSIAQSKGPSSQGAKAFGVDILQYRVHAKKQITQCEQDLMDVAIAYLAHTDMVMVDFLVRDVDGNIGTPETHTVVLFKHNAKYLVIDPSNSDYSRILMGADDDIRVCTKQLQIYKREGDSGPQFNQWRDCIDIAVKLALNIECNKLFVNIKVDEIQPSSANCGTINYKSLLGCFPVKEITNQAIVYEKLPVLLEKIPSRLKQSTDVKDVKKVSAYLKAMQKLAADFTDVDEMDCYHTINIKETAVLQASSLQEMTECFDRFTKSILQVVDCSKDLALLGVELQSIDDF